MLIWLESSTDWAQFEERVWFPPERILFACWLRLLRADCYARSGCDTPDAFLVSENWFDFFPPKSLLLGSFLFEESIREL